MSHDSAMRASRPVLRPHRRTSRLGVERDPEIFDFPNSYPEQYMTMPYSAEPQPCAEGCVVCGCHVLNVTWMLDPGQHPRLYRIV